MELSLNLIIWSIICFLPLLIHFLRPRRPANYPPGPRGWPLIGNMLELGAMPHRNVVALKQKYGPVVGLRLGTINAIVILSANAAAKFFKNHDVEFADRAIVDAMTCRNYNMGSLSLAPYGTFWRVLRRICTVEMLVAKRINESAPIRRRCVDQMLTWIEAEARNPHPIQVARFMFLTSFNMLGNLMFSKDMFDPNSKEVGELFTALEGIMECSAEPNMSDAYPWLRWLDLQGVRRRMNVALDEALRIASGYVKERMEERRKGVRQNKTKDFLDVLLDFEGDGKEEMTQISEHTINIFILELFMAGSETTSSTTEWVMTELLCKPECLAKVKDELNRVVGPNNKLEESHIDDLHYLQAVVKETLRLHAPVPFLVPRRAIKDTNFMGYDIPKDTQVLIDAWAIGRDGETWTEPNSFNPERFLDSKIEYRGQHFEFIPFGAGRRMCAGIPLAHRMLHFVAGSLLHTFDWELEKPVTRDVMDVDRMGISVRKADPLRAIPRKRMI